MIKANSNISEPSLNLLPQRPYLVSSSGLYHFPTAFSSGRKSRNIDLSKSFKRPLLPLFT
jgi:hypothetical protein